MLNKAKIETKVTTQMEIRQDEERITWGKGEKAQSD